MSQSRFSWILAAGQAGVEKSQRKGVHMPHLEPRTLVGPVAGTFLKPEDHVPLIAFERGSHQGVLIPKREIPLITSAHHAGSGTRNGARFSVARLGVAEEFHSPLELLKDLVNRIAQAAEDALERAIRAELKWFERNIPRENRVLAGLQAEIDENRSRGRDDEVKRLKVVRRQGRLLLALKKRLQPKIAAIQEKLKQKQPIDFGDIQTVLSVYRILMDVDRLYS